jgi:hypothetical protein
MVKTHCQVSKFVYDFFVHKHDSDDIVVKPGTHLASIIKPHLGTIDCRYALKGHFLRMQIPAYRGIRVKYRHYLTKEGQKMVSDELETYIRDLFLSFMTGWCMSGGGQKKGVLSFIEKHNLENSSINYDRLIKYWNRSDHKKEIFTNKIC